MSLSTEKRKADQLRQAESHVLFNYIQPNGMYWQGTLATSAFVLSGREKKDLGTRLATQSKSIFDKERDRQGWNTRTRARQAFNNHQQWREDVRALCASWREEI